MVSDLITIIILTAHQCGVSVFPSTNEIDTVSNVITIIATQFQMRQSAIYICLEYCPRELPYAVPVIPFIHTCGDSIYATPG